MATVAELLTKIGFSADTRPLEKIERRLEGLNSKLRLVAGAEVVKALYHLTEGFGHSALELMNTATAAGVTTDAMQRLQFAVAQSGGNAAELGMTMSHLARLIEGAKTGAQDALETFYRLGISQSQIASFHSTEDALYGVMDALAKVQDPIKRQALMDRALGQGSRGLGRFALSGRAAAMASQETAKRIGAIIPRTTLDALGRGKASLDSLGLMFKSVTATVGGMFAPVLVEVVKHVENFYAANRKVILQTFDDWTDEAAIALAHFVAIVEVVGGALARFVDKHRDLVVGAIKGAAALGAFSVALGTVKSAFGLLQSAWTAVGVIFTAAPYLLAASGVAIMAAAIRDLWHMLTTGDVNDLWLTKMFDAAGKFFSTGAIGKAMQSALDGAAGGLGVLGVDVRPNVATGTLRNSPGANMSRQLDQVSRLQTMVPPSVAPSASRAGGGGPVTMSTTNNINVPPGMTVEQTKQALTDTLRDTRVQELEQALRAQQRAFAY